MKTIKYRLGESTPERGAVVALGFFDGVHQGHRSLISGAVKEAERRGAPSAVFTFAYGGGVKGERAMIYTEEEREELISGLGVDFCFVADFGELRGLSPEDFVNMTLVGDIGAKVAVIGYDYRFGRLGEGDGSLLSALLEKRGGETLIFDAVMQNGAPVSSTRVRASLRAGDIRGANEMLGAPYFLSGTVEHGLGKGQSLGYPTLNISVPEGRVRLRSGVYITEVKIGENLYTGLTNVGECPTFEKREYHAETYILDFSSDIYGKRADIRFLEFIRDERVFSSVRDFCEQIEKDCAQAREYKNKTAPNEVLFAKEK